MNIFRSLIGKVWQDPNAAEVVKISTGQLYLVRPGNIRTSRECIYNEAMATIRRVPNLEHNFQLVITRVYEEGDQELLEDEDETDEERVFLISQELEFRIGENDGESTLVWRDLDGDVDEFFEFIAPGTNEPTRAFFETCMYRAMYERKYKMSADNTRDTDFQEFVWHPPLSTKVKVTPRRKVSSKANTVPSSSTSAVASSLAPEPSAKDRTPSLTKKTTDPSTESLISCEAELYSWDTKTDRFNNEGIVTASIMRPKNTSFQSWLTAENDSGLLLAHQITQDMNQRFSYKMLSLTWNHQGDDGSQSSWLFRFSEEHLAVFLQKFTECLWETLHHSSWAKLKADEQIYAVSANEDVEMRDVENDEDDEEEVLSELDPDEEASDEEEGSDEDQDTPIKIPGSDRNSQLTVGYKGDRSYVVRGNNIGVFNHSSENGVKFYGSITKLATPKGKGFKPNHVMLHDQDTKMVLMNPTEPHSLFSMDIERGKIVEEWKVHDDITVDHIAPDNKFAQTTREQTLVGVSHNSLFRIDPRVSGNKMVENEYKQYVSKNKFSGVATTASGRLAVASEKGDIRLFDSIGKNAKTALPPLGDPIIGIDVTADGRYIVATTKTYLLLIDTLIGEGRYQGSLGFDRSFPATAKPMPRRLQLRNEHVAYMGRSISFTPAKFNQGPGKEENAIVTSSGQFVIAWDFKKVKKGYLDQYEIKKYEDHVVQDNFKFGDDKEIIVALDNDVLALNKKNLKKPNRHSLAPEGSFGSRSNIVNTPY
ncbi:Vacuolar import and degradation protein 27 [Termitomyces sp. T112]|nr:Vacuolar import and degradation protein 27 [Termitomyces sp. T112]